MDRKLGGLVQMKTAFLGSMLIASFACSASAANAYKCVKPDGSTIFSDSPCGANAKSVAIAPSRKAPPSETIWCREGAAPTELVERCVDAWRPTLRDPRSAYADTGTLVHPKDSPASRQVFVDGHAKNGFGGMNALPMRCAVEANGEHVDAEGTRFWLGLASGVDPAKLPAPRIEDCDAK